MKFILAAFVLLAMPFLQSTTKKKVVFFGDSITAAGVKPGGYILKVGELAEKDKKADQYDFIGAGVSGNKVYDLYLRVEDDVLSKNPDIVVIYIGVNDVWHKQSSGTGTDYEKFEKFYNALLKKFKDKNIKVILATPAVIGERTDNSNQLDGDLNRYSDLIRSIAKANGLPLVDLRKDFIEYSKQNNPENKEQGILTSDRVHLNEKGNEFVAAAMWKAIQTVK
jgi:lysophospholipase L1-like esterase